MSISSVPRALGVVKVVVPPVVPDQDAMMLPPPAGRPVVTICAKWNPSVRP